MSALQDGPSHHQTLVGDHAGHPSPSELTSKRPANKSYKTHSTGLYCTVTPPPPTAAAANCEHSHIAARYAILAGLWNQNHVGTGNVWRGTWASRTRKRSEADYGRPEDGAVWTAKTAKRPPQQPAQPQYANYWAPLTCKRHTMPHPAQPRHTSHWAPRTRKRHQQEHRPQRRTERSDPTQHAKGRTGDCPGPRKEATTRRNVTQGDDFLG